MRIGIWCDYGFTLEPSEGIGVFVDNLARGLVRADLQCTITMMSHPGQEYKLASTVAGGDGRIRVVSVPKLKQPQRFAVRWLKKVRQGLTPNAIDSTAAKPSSLVQFIDRRIAAFCKSQQQAVAERVDTCDVWLLPYVGLDQDIEKPTVVAIHDLVCYHFPDMLTPHKLERLKRLVHRVANRATIAACMSEFIRDNDLFGMLNLPAERVRVVKAAVPDDLVVDASSDKVSDEANSLPALGVDPQSPYLLYPAAFRSYKNHRYLIDALQQLRERSTENWKLIFTGIRRLPRDLKQQIQRLGLEADVQALGKVSRSQLEVLYCHAFATVVPSLYEQGSFPIMEALHCRCPVACSNIPSLCEQFAGMGASMMYFDPHDTSSLVHVIEKINANRSQVIAEQQEGFLSMQSHTWEDSARQWLRVLREATMLGDSIAAARASQRAA